MHYIICFHGALQCGYKTCEVKTGGGTPDKGKVMTLSVPGDNPEDMSRDILKSVTASVVVRDCVCLL